MKIGVLWDLDGTLLDTLEDLKDAVNATLIHYGLPERTLDEVRRFVGNGVVELMRRALPGSETDPDLMETIAYYQSYYKDHARIKTRPYEGVEETLSKVGEKYPVAIVSNKPDEVVKVLCDELFPGVYALGVVPECPRKPAPDMVYKAMKELAVDACVYVGDSEVDVLTAKNTQVPCISVLWGFRDRKTLEESGAKYFCEKAEDLPALLEQIVGEVYGK